MLTTARLRLRPFVLADVPALYAMSGEPGMRQWIPDQVYASEAHATEVVRGLMAHTAHAPDPRTKPYVLGVDHTASGELIGHVGLSAARGSVEIGYAIGDRWQGQGFASEAVTAVAAWALAELDLPEVLGVVGVENHASRRVLAHAGFVPDAAPDPGGRVMVYRRTRAAPR